jgi:hypothetical protein
MSLTSPILEYGAACWDPYRECHISALDRVHKKDVHHSVGTEWESLVQRRKIRMCALYKTYTVQWALKAIGDRLQGAKLLK